MGIGDVIELSVIKGGDELARVWPRGSIVACDESLNLGAGFDKEVIAQRHGEDGDNHRLIKVYAGSGSAQKLHRAGQDGSIRLSKERRGAIEDQ